MKPSGRPRILLVNPPIYDFSAFDFWLRPYGLLRVAGRLRGRADLAFFDFLDRRRPGVGKGPSDSWGRGKFRHTVVEKPAALRDIPRRFKRYGAPQEDFVAFLETRGPFDAVLIQGTMTYWYPGIGEVLQAVRSVFPRARCVIGGPYAAICRDHARRLGADLVVSTGDLTPLRDLWGIQPSNSAAPWWEAYGNPDVVAVKLADGCPLRCTYCAVPWYSPGFQPRPAAELGAVADQLLELQPENVVFYDDALLYQAGELLLPFLARLRDGGLRAAFHTPNALHARLLTRDLARTLVDLGFVGFFLGFESASARWQDRTGRKVSGKELARAVAYLLDAGAAPRNITCYLIAGHPAGDQQELEASLRFVHSLGVRAMLAEFSPIPGTPDGEACRTTTDLDEPLHHNKLAWTIRRLGAARLQELKDLANELNREVEAEDGRGTGSRQLTGEGRAKREGQELGASHERPRRTPQEREN
ncbi:MAG: B12-binding domain-containing radical SAM protein [Acidobacteriota bacterium]